MIQRIQSLYLLTVYVAMALFLYFPFWEKACLTFSPSPITLAYVAVTASHVFPKILGLPIIGVILCVFPFVFSASILGVAAYAIIRHDNRKIQLRYTTGILFMLLVLIIITFYCIKLMDTLYPSDHYPSNYRIGIFFPFIALIASLLARRSIRQDEDLVNDDCLR